MDQYARRASLTATRALKTTAWHASGFLLALAIALAAPVTAHAITPVGSSSQADNGSAVSVNRPPDAQEGDLIVAQVAFRGDSGDAIAAPAGWSPIRRTDGSDVVQAAFFKVAEAIEPAEYTWSVGGQRIAVIHSAYRGVDPDVPIAADSGRTGTGLTVTASSVSISDSPTRLVGLFSAAQGGAEFTSAPLGMTARESPFTRAGNSGSRALLADEAISSDGATGDREAVSGVDAANIGQLIALRPATSGQAAALRFSVQPSESKVGQVITPAIEVQVVDADGALVSDSAAEIALSIETNPAGGTLSGTTVVKAVDGVATFDDLSIDEIGDGYTLRASATDLDPDISDPFDIVEPEQEANAFDPDTPPGEIIGDLSTRVAGEAFSMDIVAIDDGEVDQGFNDTVDVWLLDASDNSGNLDEVNCRDSWSRIQNLGTIAFDGSENGRAQLTGIEEPESWHEVRIQIERVSPPGQAGIIGCSNDPFAIRPAALVDVQATDTDPATAGDDRVLGNTDPGGSPVHIASAPFSVEARAVNAKGNTTQNYDGAPAGEITCIEADSPCESGSFDAGAWSQSNGVLTTDSARYDEVGAFELVLEDRQYAAIDQGDSTESERFVRSATSLGVGRFIPDHFSLASSALVDRIVLDDAGCPSSFTYTGEALELSFELLAENGEGTRTRNYAGDWARLTTVTELDFGAVDSGSNLTGDLVLPGWQSAWAQGELAAAYRIRLDRADPGGPFDAFEIGIRPVDGDGVRLPASAAQLDVDGSGNHAKLGETIIRFGRLVIDNAGGAEVAPIDVPIRLEYWTGDTWEVNESDDCTALDLADEIQLHNGDTTVRGDQDIAVSAGTTRISNSTGGALLFTGGTASATFEPPGEGNTGWVDMDALAGASTDYPFLRGEWEDGDSDWDDPPEGRVSFGIYRGHDRWIDMRRVRAQ